MAVCGHLQSVGLAPAPPKRRTRAGRTKSLGLHSVQALLGTAQLLQLEGGDLEPLDRQSHDTPPQLFACRVPASICKLVARAQLGKGRNRPRTFVPQRSNGFLSTKATPGVPDLEPFVTRTHRVSTSFYRLVPQMWRVLLPTVQHCQCHTSSDRNFRASCRET